jgi:cytochrome c2
MKNWILSLAVTGALSAGLGMAADKPGDAAKGKKVFEQCAVCHNTTTDDVKVGPSLKSLYKHATLKDGKKVSDATVKAKIETGGNGMPAYKDLLSDGDKSDLLAFLKTL